MRKGTINKILLIAILLAFIQFSIQNSLKKH